MKAYKTLRGETLDLDQLSPKARAVYAKIKAFYDTNPNPKGSEFKRFRFAETKKGVFKGIEGPIIDEPLFKICQDLEMRLYLKEQEERNESQKPNNDQK